MKVAKRFRWEAAHRLPWHTGGCQNLHGHSYQLWVDLEGRVNPQGMVLDFKDLKRVLKPLVEAWDHATLVDERDTPLLEAVRALGSKHVILPFDTTSENMALFIADYLVQEAGSTLVACGASRITVRLYETETCYAEVSRDLDA